ncbi:MAG TPA: hypothetical protein VKU41_12835 [Polyangiaceae bacterium]|nr:hypothetical protein [Polyangiaceae bacterium]
MKSPILAALLSASVTAGLGGLGGCDDTPKREPPERVEAAALPTAPPSPAPEARAPDIVVETSKVTIGTDRIATGESGLADKVAVFVNGRPLIEGHTVDVVAMRNAKPSHVAAVVTALRGAKASGVVIKSSSRDNSTQPLPLSFTTNVPACTPVAWIAKDAAVDVWPAGGGTAKRIPRGLAGPDVTLGNDAIGALVAKCDAPVVVVGADEAMTWGLVFDLAMTALHSPTTRGSSAVLVTSATPGRKLALE